MPTPQGTVDPDVKLPAAVRRAAAAADAAFQAAKGEPEKKPEGESPETIGEPVPVGTNTPPSSAPEQAPTQPAPEQAPTQPAPQTDDLERRYKILEGRYKAEQTAHRQLATEVSHLRRLIANLKMAQPATPPATGNGQAPPEVKKLVTPEEEQEFGAEFLDVVARKAKEIYDPKVQELQRQVETLQQRLGQTAQVFEQDSRSKLFQTLDQKLPNWRDINRNPDFVSWLRLPDRFSGAIRQELLNAAFARHDAGRVAAFFEGFLAEEAASAPQNKGAQTPAAVTPPGNTPSRGAAGKVPLEQLAAPGRARSAAATSAPAEKPIIAPADITKFYSDVAAGKYRGNQKEKERIEQMIFDAQMEGRIR